MAGRAAAAAAAGAALLLQLVAAPALGRRGAVLVALKDLGLDDLAEDALGAADDGGIGRLLQALPHEAASFRAAAPDTVPGLAGIAAGRRPSELGIVGGPELGHQAAPQRLPEGANLFEALRDEGVLVGHFGLWPFQDDLADLADAALVTDHFGNAMAAAQDFLASVPPDRDFFLSLWLPRIDATTDFGGTFSEAGWALGFPAVNMRKNDASALCYDTFRGEDRDYTRRYTGCPRHTYRANRGHEVTAVARLMEHVAELSGDLFAAVTSASGPESWHVDGNVQSIARFRGLKRSLYDGGLRVPFRFQRWENGSPAVPTNGAVISADLNAVDIAPTLLDMFGISPSQAWADGMSGVSFIGCVESPSTECEVTRRSAQMWEWRYRAPGHCTDESPRFAIMMGPFKLLLEPNSGRPRELFDLSLAMFEKTNIANSSLVAGQGRLETILDIMQSELERWIDSLPAAPGAAPAEYHPGCLAGLASQFQVGALSGSLAATGAKRAALAPSVADASPMAAPNVTATAAANAGQPLQGIVMLLADDMGAGDTSAFNGQVKPFAFEPETPAYDDFMRAGVTLSHFYSDGPVCSPSRAALVTGRRPSHKNVRVHNAIDKEGGRNSQLGITDYLGQGVDFKKSLTTMPRFFKDNGFVTAHFGKWHMGYDYSADPERDIDGAMFGVDEYMIYGYDLTLAYSLKKWERTIEFPTASQPHRASLDNKDLYFSSYAQEALINRTLDFVRDRAAAKDRFFVQVWLQNPHAPFNLDKSDQQAAEMGFPTSDNPLPTRNASNPIKASAEKYLPLQIYRTLMRDQESQLARLVDEIDNLGLAESTLIVLSSDNGPEVEGINFAATGSSSPFRGRKRSLYEGGIRVPFAMVWKDGPLRTPGTVLPTPASLIDLFPTLASLAGLSPEFRALPDAADVQGRDLSCLVLDGEQSCNSTQQQELDERTVFFEYRDEYIGECLGVAPRFAARRGRFKLLWEQRTVTLMYPKLSDATGRMELYDVVADPAEHTNLLITRPADPVILALAEELRALIITDFVGASSYDRKTAPSTSWLKARKRLDRTRHEIRTLERCSVANTSKGDEPITISTTALAAVRCSLDWLCNGSTSPTFETRLVPSLVPSGSPATPGSDGGESESPAPSPSPSESSSPAESPSMSPEPSLTPSQAPVDTDDSDATARPSRAPLGSGAAAGSGTSPASASRAEVLLPAFGLAWLVVAQP